MGENGSYAAYDENGKEIMLETNEKENLSAQVFKTIVDPFVGRISYVKVLSGVLGSDSIVYNANKEKPEKVSSVFIIKGQASDGCRKAVYRRHRRRGQAAIHPDQ